MSDALRRQQQAFAAALLAPAAALPAGALPPGPAGLEADLVASRGSLLRGLAVYRTNVRLNYANALAAAFPALRVVLGSDEFASLAWSCQRARPAASGDLFQAGAALAEFVAAHTSGTPAAALADLAALEWAIQQVMVAADATTTLDLAALAAVPAEQHGALTFTVVPSLRVLAVAAGTAATWERWREEEPGDAGVGLSGVGAPVARPIPPLPAPAARLPSAATSPVSGGSPPGTEPEFLRVWRDGGRLRVAEVTAADHAFLAAVGAGEALGAALAVALDADPAADPGALLSRAAAAGLLTGFCAPGLGSADPA